MSELFAHTAAGIAAALALLWLASLALRDASIVDIFWGPGFALVAGISAWLTGALGSPRGALLCGMTALWGLRLGLYLGWRNAGKAEDPRYAAMRRHWGPRFPWVSLGTVFALQGALMWIISLPVQLGALAPGPAALGGLDLLGAGIWAVGLAFESTGDWQLARFKADPANAGRVMDRGLWRYTRHPNYFGDACVWWGLWGVAASTAYGVWTLPSPLLMTFLLLRVSGVALLESTIETRRPAYAAYRARTSAFLPWPPRSGPSDGSR